MGLLEDVVRTFLQLPPVTRVWTMCLITSLAVFAFRPQYKTFVHLKWSAVMDGQVRTTLPFVSERLRLAGNVLTRQVWRPITSLICFGGKLQTAHFFTLYVRRLASRTGPLISRCRYILCTTTADFERRLRSSTRLLLVLFMGSIALLVADFLIVTNYKSMCLCSAPL